MPLLFMHESLLLTLISVFLVFIMPVTYMGGFSFAISSLYPMMAREQCAEKGGRGVIVRWRWKHMRKCARGIIMARYLLCQAEDRYQIPIWLPDPQGNRKASSTDHAGVWTHDCNCDLAVDPSTYVWNGFLDFPPHELTTIWDND